MLFEWQGETYAKQQKSAAAAVLVREQEIYVERPAVCVCAARTKREAIIDPVRPWRCVEDGAMWQHDIH